MFWRCLPFRHMTLLVLALFVIKEQFPFSNFPMYSNFDSEADVIYIANRDGEPLAMDEVFRSGSGTAKKACKKELGKLTQAAGGRDSNSATASERAQAGVVILGDWHAIIKPRKVPAGTMAIRLYRRTFELKDRRLGGGRRS